MPSGGGQEALEETTDALLLCDDLGTVEKASHAGIRGLAIVNSMQVVSGYKAKCWPEAYSCVFMLSNGVTANSDSVAPAPKPAITVAGPEIWPSSSASMFL